MITPSEREAMQLELAAYVSGQLDVQRAAEVRRALETDAALRADLACVEAVASRLAEAAVSSDPTDEVLPPFDVSRLPDRRTAGETFDTPPAAVPRRGGVVLAAMSGAAALVVAFVAAVVLAGPPGAPGTDATTVASAGPSVQLAVVDAKVAGTNAVATMNDVDGRPSMQVAAAGLPAAPPDHHYEVWLMRDGTPTSVGRLDGATAVFALPDDAEGGWDAVDVSIEPDDGDPSHSGDSVLRGPIA